MPAPTQKRALRLVPGIIIRSGENMYTRPWQEITSLAAMPLPAYHLFDTSFYNRMNVPWAWSPSGGVPFGCSYCSSSFAPGQQ
ncbi:MAG: hypothetical protein U5K27_02865 [Desulfotignum sp.]|nr:hypothetical protein [Desulfotignum sp.]